MDSDVSILQVFVAASLVILAVFGLWKRRTLYILYKTLPRDIKGIYRALRYLLHISFLSKRNETVPKIFSKLAKKHPHKITYYFEDQQWTYQQLDEYSNKIANFFKARGYKRGDSLALMLENRPEYVGIWLGLSKIGVVASLINTNLVSDPLVHCILASKNKGLVFGNDFLNAITQIKSQIDQVELYEFTEDGKASGTMPNLTQQLQNCPHTTPPDVWEGSSRDKMLYVYTSGTTGLPKPAIITHSRYMLAAGAPYFLQNLGSGDIFYDSLPLYHSSGGMLGAGQCLLFGIPVVLRRKFSASNFWIDCQKYECTSAVYVGELCRYLLTAYNGKKVDHKVRKMCGNGLRREIWQEFCNTFGVTEIYEFYASTEGNCQLVNMDGRVGAVGFTPIYLQWLAPVFLIKCNETTGEPIRNPNGFYTRCNYGEPGLLIGAIKDGNLVKTFSGYADQKDTQKKILRDVLVKGDKYFNTGDVLVQDEFGYFYFKDRTGDTFRWKGENVSTCEVEGIVSKLAGDKDATVFGVEVPGTDGKAGMAAIADPDDTVDVQALAKGLKSKLPSYAIPLFLGVLKSVPLTSTFKMKKLELQRNGFDLDKTEGSRLYFLDSKSCQYVPLTNELRSEIVNGKVRL